MALTQKQIDEMRAKVKNIQVAAPVSTDKFAKMREIANGSQSNDAQDKTGAVGKTANFINSAYSTFSNLPGIKQAGQVFGGAVGALGGLVGGVVGAVGTPIANAAKGRPAFENIGENIKKTAGKTAGFGYEEGKAAVPAYLTGGAGRVVQGALAFGQGYQGYQDIKQGIKEKDIAKTVQGGLELGTSAVAAHGAVKTNGLLLNKDFTAPIASTVSEAVLPKAKVEAMVVKDTNKVLTGLREGNQKVSRVFEEAKAQGHDVQSDLANSDFLVGSVNKNGRINTRKAGGAIDKVKTILEPGESVVRDNIVRENKRVSLQYVEQEMLKNIENSNIRGAAKITAIKKVKQEIEGLRLKADKFDTVPLEEIHDTKVYKGKNINYTDKDVQNADKAITNALKRIVEDNVDGINVKEINAELSKYYAMLRVLDKLHGSTIEGGRLGKYATRMLGAIAGSKFGPVGAAVGAEVSGGLHGLYLKSFLTKELGKNPTLSKTLQDAIKLGGTPMPKQEFLKLPAPDKTKTGVTIPMGQSTTYEPRAKIVGGEGQNPKMGLLQRPLSLPEPTGFTGEPIRAGQATTFEPRAKTVGTTPKVIDAKATVVDSKDVIKKLRGAKKAPTPVASTEKALMAEAKKYKSAEEFVKAQPTFYRGEGGTDVAQGKALLAEGRHFAMDGEYPKRFGEVKEYAVKPNARIFDASGLDFPDIRKKLGLSKGSYLSKKEYTNSLKERGYDVLKYDGAYRSTGKPFVHIVEITPDSLVPKSKLTDIWNKANKN